MGVEVEAGGVGGRPDRALRGAYDGWRALAGPLADFVLPMPFLAEASIAPVRPFHPGAARLAEALARIARSDGGAAAFRGKMGSGG